MTIEQYIQNINNRYKQGNATEHTFRGDLQQLLKSFVPEMAATNEPKRQKCGAPDYIYAVPHSPTYREKYKEFLKIDFPRIPYPKNQTDFKNLSDLGSQLHQIHLLESPVVENYITPNPVDGNNVVDKIFCHSDEGGISPNKESKPNSSFVPQEGKAMCNIYINEIQHFANVPKIAWKFYIGGYQPA